MSDDQSKRQTVEQRRAAHAWKQIEAVAKQDYKKEYAQLVRGFAAMIQHDGLGSALAFLDAKAKGKGANQHHDLHQHLSAWVLKEMNAADHKTLLTWLLLQDSATYRHATTETLAYLGWLKRFAEAKGWGDD